MAKPNSVDIIIPSYNGLYLLKKNLAIVVKNTPNLNRLIIVDNGSTDGTSEWLSENFPKAKVYKNSTNIGFTIAINQAVSLSDSSHFVLLNNDVRPEKGYLSTIFNRFKDKTLFAVTFNEKNSSWPCVKWEKGKLQYTRGADKTKPVFSAWASGGSACFSRSIWNKLNGFDEIYAPWYWEDIDIGYRAWKSGFKIIWDPELLVTHNHESTSKKLNENYVNLIKERNELLFNWLNIKDPYFFIQHLFWLVYRTVTHPGYIKVVLVSLFRLVAHKSLKRNFRIGDKEVLGLISKSV